MTAQEPTAKWLRTAEVIEKRDLLSAPGIHPWGDAGGPRASCARQTDGAGALRRRVVRGIDDKVATVSAAGAVQYFHTHRLGSVVAVSDGAGAAAETYAYSAYGESDAALTGNPWRYTGRYLDAETGLYYYRARYYSAWLGQFLQTDPIGTKDDPNLYGYVGLDPGTNIDPSGLSYERPKGRACERLPAACPSWQTNARNAPQLGRQKKKSPAKIRGGTRVDRALVDASVSRVVRTTRGKQLEAERTASQRSLRIQLNDRGVNNGNPAYGYIQIDPNSRPIIDTTAGPQPASTDRIVAHEYGHWVTGTPDNGPEQMNNVRQNENPIITELGEPARTRY